MKVFTYKDQPWDNVDAWRLGEACRKAAQNPGGDYIDGGLELLKQLQEKGFGVVKLEEAQHPTSALDSAADAEVLAYGIGDMTVDRVRQLKGSDLWAVRSGSMCLSTNGEWDWEPMPSSRDDEWIATHRFKTADEAILAAISAKEQK